MLLLLLLLLRTVVPATRARSWVKKTRGARVNNNEYVEQLLSLSHKGNARKHKVTTSKHKVNTPTTDLKTANTDGSTTCTQALRPSLEL